MSAPRTTERGASSLQVGDRFVVTNDADGQQIAALVTSVMLVGTKTTLTFLVMSDDDEVVETLGTVDNNYALEVLV